MTNSSLICYTNLSPNHSNGRNHKIDRITPHYMDGNLTVEQCGQIFANPNRRASSNYGIGSDGRIACYVEEQNRAWTSGSAYNDNRAVTIECANYSDGSLSNACWDSLVALCVDICLRNGIASLDYTGDDSGNLTMHKWYQDTDCPGPWLSKKFDELAKQVNRIMEGDGHKPSTNPANNHSGGRLVCDGIVGYNTVTDMQAWLHTPIDGVISGQWKPNKIYIPAVKSIEWGGQGSQMVCALQREIDTEVDGIWGRKTSATLQTYLVERGYDIGKCGIDGYFGSDSAKALQRFLNGLIYK